MFILTFKYIGKENVLTYYFDTEDQMYDFIKRQDIRVLKVEIN